MRLFVACVPPAPVLDVVEALDRPAVDGVRWDRRELWHVTLRFLGEVEDPAPVAAALDAADLRPAVADLGPRVDTLGPKVVCIPVAGLDDLAGAVVAATAGFGQPPEDRPFRGHLTLARVRRGSARRVAGQPVFAAFPVADVRLVRSHLGGEGARYEDLHVRAIA